MKLLSNFKIMCTPAQLYFGISMLAFFLILIQNYGSNDTYCLGHYKCETEHGLYFFVAKLVYILFWTFILHLICKSGFQTISWIIVLLPFISMFLLLGLMIYNQNVINEPFDMTEDITDYLVDTMDEDIEDEEYMIPEEDMDMMMEDEMDDYVEEY